MNISRSRSNDSRHRPAPSTTVSSGSSESRTGTPGLVLDAPVHAPEQRATADEMDPHLEQVLRELGRRLREGELRRIHDGLHRLLDRLTDLLRVEHDGPRQPTHEIATAHLGLVVVGGRVRGADRELDLLCSALTYGDAVVAPQVGLDGAVDVEATDAHRLQRDDPAE